MIWIVHFIVVTLLLLIAIKIKKDRFFIKTSFLYSLLIFGHRWMVGTDFRYYLRYYITDYQVREPIYKFLQQFLYANNLYFGLLIFIVFAITLYNNYRFLIKIDKNVVLMIYIFLLSEIYFAQLSQIRQFVAISFFINAYFNVFEKKYGRSLINILLGAGFHTSILFVVPFLFIKVNLDRIKTLYGLVIAAILPTLNVTLLLKLPFFSRYAHYVDSQYNVSLSPFHLMKFYLLLLIIFVFVWNVKKFKSVEIEQLILHGIIWNMIIYGLSFQFAPIIRLSSYFKIFELVFLIYYLNEVRYFSNIIKKSVVVSFFTIVYLGLAVTDPYEVTNYQFRHLRLYDERNFEQLEKEINTFP